MLNVFVKWSEKRVQGGHKRAAGISMALKMATERAVDLLTELKREKYRKWVEDQIKLKKNDYQSSEQTDHTWNSKSKYYVEGKFELIISPKKCYQSF